MKRTLLILSLSTNLLLIAILGVFIHTVGGPQYFWFRLTHAGATGMGEGRTTLFRELAGPSGAMVMLGDSLIKNGEWPELLALPDVVNRGITGQWSSALLDNMDYVSPLQPRSVFLMTGVNDLRSRSPEAVAETIRQIVLRLQSESPRSPVFVQSVLPVNNLQRNTGRNNEDVVALNREIQALCSDSKSGCHYIDLHSHFLDAGGRLDSRYSFDGVHLNGEGYRLWASLIAPHTTVAPAAEPTRF